MLLPLYRHSSCASLKGITRGCLVAWSQCKPVVFSAGPNAPALSEAPILLYLLKIKVTLQPKLQPFCHQSLISESLQTASSSHNIFYSTSVSDFQPLSGWFPASCSIAQSRPDHLCNIKLGCQPHGLFLQRVICSTEGRGLDELMTGGICQESQ